MSIDNLTIAEAREIAAMFAQMAAPMAAPKTSRITDSFIGKYVIVRSRNEGVNAGYVESADETGIVLRNARRLWYHKPAVNAESWYEGVANHGVSADSKISAKVSIKAIIEGYSITVCTDKAQQSIERAPSHAQS